MSSENEFQNCQEDARAHHCHGCPNDDKCRLVWSEENKGPLSPAGLALASVAAFLMPLSLAIVAGAILPTDVQAYKILGCLGGLIIGILLAWPTVAILKKKFPSQNQ